MAHGIFGIFLVFFGLTAVLAFGLHSYVYRLTPLSERAFPTDYKDLKPSCTFSHGLGVLGATMTTLGVIAYSSRERFRKLWNLGKPSMWLEFHIFTCLLGPVLVVFDTTFKHDGIAVICLWTMLSVAASGIVRLFLYVLMSRNMNGSEPDSHQINEGFKRIGKTLRELEIVASLIKRVDSQFAAIKRSTSLRETISTFLDIVDVSLWIGYRWIL